MRKFLCLLVVALFLATAAFAADFDGYIVKIKENTYENMSFSVFSEEEACLFSEMDDAEIALLMTEELPMVSDISFEHLYLKAEDDEALALLVEMGVVESYEKDVFAELCGFDVTDNASYSSQKWIFDSINADFAWNMGICGNDVKVAVVDSGVYPNEDIADNILPGFNYYTNEADYSSADTYDYSSSSHGTMVAGLIAAQCNSLSTVGLAFNSKIVPLRVTDGASFSVSYAVSAIYDAVDVFECDVINLSFGTTSYSDSLYNAISYAVSNGVIVVAASGNYGNKTSSGVYNPVIYPAAMEPVISVANAESYNGSFRIYKSSTHNEAVDIAAPGSYVLSLLNSSSGTKSGTGTSFSSPIVAAAAALAKSVNPDIQPSEFLSMIKLTADASCISSSQGSEYWGAGLLDVRAFLIQLLSGMDCYISDIHYYDGAYFALVTNPSAVNTVEECTVTFSYYSSDGSLISFNSSTFSLGALETKEIPLTSANVSVSCIIDHIPGDVNNDKTVNNRDASAILRYLSGYAISVSEAALDVNGDGKINNRDASAILRYLAGYAVQLY